MTADFATPADDLDRAAALRRADPALAADAGWVAEYLAAVANGSVPIGEFWKAVDGLLLGSVVATWGPSSQHAAALAPHLADYLARTGWTLTAQGWCRQTDLHMGGGHVSRHVAGHLPSVAALARPVVGEARWQRQLVAPPDPDAGRRANHRDEWGEP